LLEDMKNILPIMLFLVIIFSFLISVIYTKFVTSPVLKAAKAAEHISAMKWEDSEIMNHRKDEIGTLFRNIHFASVKLKKAAEERNDFFSAAAHELKTPLTSISGFAEIIKTGMVKEEDIPRFAGRIYDEAQRLITLVEDIIKLSQLDEKQITEKKERIDLYLLCQDVVFNLEKPAADRRISISLIGEHIYAEVVQQIAEEIVYNLCDNAIKYNKAGGSVTVAVSEKNGRPEITVSDTGIGIAKEELDRVFERFYRVNKSHSKEIGGTGLGLSIVKHGAAYHGAQLNIESNPGVGTHISIRF